MKTNITRSELREEIFKRFPISKYEDPTKEVILYGSVTPLDKITYIVFCSKMTEHGPWKNQEVPLVKLAEAIAQYNSFVKEGV